MKSQISLIFLFLLILQTSLSHADAVEDKVNIIIDNYMAANQIPGAAVALHYNGKDYVFNKGYANVQDKKLVTSDTIFELASVTKIFTSTTLAYGVLSNKINLKDPVYKFIPELKDANHIPFDAVTFLDLATHTASFPRNVQGFGVERGDKAGFLEKLKTWNPPYPIGTKFRYSNISFGLLGIVNSDVFGSTYYEALTTTILSPLAMHNTYIYVPKDKLTFEAQGYGPENQPVPHFIPTQILGGGELRSSIADLANFLKANMKIGTLGNPTLVAAMQLAHKPYFKVKPVFTMGLGWQLLQHDGDMYITKNGANHGFHTFIGFNNEKGIGIVVLFNKAGSGSGKLGFQIIDALSKS